MSSVIVALVWRLPARVVRRLAGVAAIVAVSHFSISCATASENTPFDMTMREYVAQPTSAQDANYILNRCASLFFALGQYMENEDRVVAGDAYDDAALYLLFSQRIGPNGGAGEEARVREMSGLYLRAMRQEWGGSNDRAFAQMRDDIGYCQDRERVTKDAGAAR